MLNGLKLKVNGLKLNGLQVDGQKVVGPEIEKRDDFELTAPKSRNGRS